MSIAEIQHALNNTNADYKAEVLLSILMEEGLQDHDVVINNTGVFKRAYRKDLMGGLLHGKKIVSTNGL